MNYNNLTSEGSYIKLDDFALCNIKLDSGWVGVHPKIDNYGLYYYLYDGSPKLGVAFETTLINLTKGALTSTKNYLDKSLLLETSDSCDMFIFNTIDKTQDWTGSLVTKTFDCDNSNSYLICIDGTPTVNSTTLQKYDYSKLESGKKYSVTLNGGVLGLFTKLAV